MPIAVVIANRFAKIVIVTYGRAAWVGVGSIQPFGFIRLGHADCGKRVVVVDHEIECVVPYERETDGGSGGGSGSDRLRQPNDSFYRIDCEVNRTLPIR